MASTLRVLMVGSEAVPWAKTGGLGDVLGALPAALARLGHDVTLVLPKYRGIPAGGDASDARVSLGSDAFEIRLWSHQVDAGPRVVFVDYPPFFDRDGLYGRDGADYPDNARRFGLLAVAALEVAAQREPPHVVHAHDWQAGLVPTLLRTRGSRLGDLAQAATVFTIHNLAYQGRFPRDVVPQLGLDWSAFTVRGGEFWNDFSFLKSGINYSDWVTTVSPTYARETLTPEFGCGFEGVLAARQARYVGILNGIDTLAWDPSQDVLLPAHFEADQLDGKRACKRALLESFGLSIGDDAMSRPLIGMVSRLVDQKGFDLIAAAGEALFAQDATWVVVGSGDARYERLWRELGDRYPRRVGVLIGFDEARAHLVEAGADMFLMPSLFEPCGLNQMYSLRYGTVPIVHAVGGLDDTVAGYTPRVRRANGFKFGPATGEALSRSVRQAIAAYHTPPVWAALMRTGMRADHSWDRAAREYVKVYRRARADVRARAAAPPPIQ